MSASQHSGAAPCLEGGVYMDFIEKSRSQLKTKSNSGYINDIQTPEKIITSLANYNKSLSNHMILELIRNIGQIVKELGGNMDSRSIDIILSSIITHLPNPDKGSTIRASREKINKIINTITTIINSKLVLTYKENIVNPNLFPSDLLKQLNKLIDNLLTGTIEDYNLYIKILEQTSDAVNLKLEMKEQNSDVQQNIDCLKNQLDKTIHILQEDHLGITSQISDFTAKQTKINKMLNNWNNDSMEDENLGDTVAYTLSCLGDLAQISYTCNNSLNSVVKKLTLFTKFTVVDNIVSTISKTKAITNNKKISQTLKQYFSRHIIEGGGTEGCSAMFISGGEYSMDNEAGFSDMSGGELENFITGGARRAIRIEERSPEEIEREMKRKRAETALKTFLDDMNKELNKFTENIIQASKYLGTTNYDIQKVQDYLENMKYVEGLRDPNIYLSMIGYYVDESYRGLTDQYRDRLQKTIRGFNELGSQIPAARRYFTAAAGNIRGYIKGRGLFSRPLKKVVSSKLVLKISKV